MKEPRTDEIPSSARLVVPHDSSDVQCPDGHRLYGITIEDGVLWARCPGKVMTEGGQRERCPLHLHILSARGISFVLAMSSSEAAEYRPLGLQPLKLYQALGAIIALRSHPHGNNGENSGDSADPRPRPDPGRRRFRRP